MHQDERSQIEGPIIPKIEDFAGDNVCLRDICSKAIRLFDEFRFVRGVENIKTSTADFFSYTALVPIKIETVSNGGEKHILRRSISLTLEQFDDQGPIESYVTCSNADITANTDDEFTIDIDDLGLARQQASKHLDIGRDDRSMDKLAKFFQAYENLLVTMSVVENFTRKSSLS